MSVHHFKQASAYHATGSELPRNFPDGAIFALSEGEHVYLCGPELDAISEVSEVHKRAEIALRDFYVALKLVQPNLEAMNIGRVVLEDDDGQRKVFVLVHGSSHARGRSKTTAVLTVNTSRPEEAGPTQAQQILAVMKQTERLRTAAQIVSDPDSSWPHIHRAYEEVERFVREKRELGLVDAQLCSRAELQRFKQSANSPEVAGKDSRHALGGPIPPPGKPMALAEARAFVSKMLKAALQMNLEEQSKAEQPLG